MAGASLCFIGSSTEGKPWAKAVALHLEAEGVPYELWDQATFSSGETTIESLEQQFRAAAFAVFVITPDDLLVKRGEEKFVPRDNVMLEFGMALGAFGRRRSFLLCPEEFEKYHLPSDLHGMALLTYAHEAEHHDDLKASKKATFAACAEIADAIKKQGTVSPLLDGGQVDDLLDGLSSLVAQWEPTVKAGAFNEWPQRVVNSVNDRFIARQDDAYAIWLRPDSNGKLRHYLDTNLVSDYVDHPWKPNEGLAGWVWFNGGYVAVSKLRTHPRFVSRPGCENESYICMGVGDAGGAGGLLAVGSDKGFTEEPGDRGFMVAYASLLDLGLRRTEESTGIDAAYQAVSGVAKVPMRSARWALNRLQGSARETGTSNDD